VTYVTVTVTEVGAAREGDPVTVIVAVPLCVVELVMLVEPEPIAHRADVFIGTSIDDFAAAVSIALAGEAWAEDGSP
jgi:hypothetical protein